MHNELLYALFQKYKSKTMIAEAEFVSNLRVVHNVLSQVSGAIVECGTWRGGMSAALIEVGGPKLKYFFFDSFEGLPPAKQIDGTAALAYQANTSSPTYYDNCSATLDEFNDTLKMTGTTPDIQVVKGYYEQTMPQLNPDPRSVAILRLDCDWYDSVTICLETFWQAVIPGGAILIDDYYMWDGCSRAVHDFLSRKQATERISQASPGLAVITKR